jgi:GNAT superfamily N-acetyltransferase
MRCETDIHVRNTRPEDFGQIEDLCAKVYRHSPPWTEIGLSSHLRVFPEGQFVAEDRASAHIVGMAASLIVLWDDYGMETSWRDFTDRGLFTNHNPKGRTLYGAEVMVDPALQGRGVGSRMYAARRDLVRRLGLLRIRAGARLRGYHRYADRMSPEEYVENIVRGEIGDPTLSFQLKHGFVVIGVANDYLHNDPESLGHAAVIEWLNDEVARPEDGAGRDPRYQPSRRE